VGRAQRPLRCTMSTFSTNSRLRGDHVPNPSRKFVEPEAPPQRIPPARLRGTRHAARGTRHTVRYVHAGGPACRMVCPTTAASAVVTDVIVETGNRADATLASRSSNVKRPSESYRNPPLMPSTPSTPSTPSGASPAPNASVTQTAIAASDDRTRAAPPCASDRYHARAGARCNAALAGRRVLPTP
jgi:hypothetical protein